MRIIALVPGGISDQILFFPTLDNLKQVYPDAQIDVVVEPRAKDAYRVSKSVHETIAFDFEGGNSLADWGNLLGVMRDREYALALSPKQSWSMALLLWIAGIPMRLGYTGSPGAFFLTNLATLKQDQYAAQMYHDLLKGLGLDTPCPELSVNVSTKDLDWADNERKRLGVQNSGYVLIHAGSTQFVPRKGMEPTYPVESWRGILQDFQQRQPDLPIVLVQDSETEAFLEAIVRANPQVKVTVPRDIGKLAAMLAGANLALCTEGVTMHLAIAVKTYTLALFGASDPKKLMPDSSRFIGIKSLTGKMADISPQTVLEKVWGG